MAGPQVTQLPTAPSRQDPPDTFITNADAFLKALPQFGTELNALQTDVANNTTTASNAATNASTSASNALAAQQLAQSAANATPWVSAKTYAKNDTAISQLNYRPYRRTVAGAGTTDPASDSANWVAVTGAQVTRSARSSNTVLGMLDAAALIDITSGTFTQTFTAAATLGAGWWCYVRNSGSGDITLDPNASELIDGLTSYIMYPGETRLITCDGVGFTSIVVTSFYRVFTTSGSFVTPPGYSVFSGFAWGGGGSGNFSSAGGGGGGGCTPFTLPATMFGASQTVTVGAGGAGVTVDPGLNGGNTTLGTFITAYGGLGGTANDGGAGGNSTSNLAISPFSGGTGGHAYHTGSNAPGAAGSTFYGGGGGGVYDGAYPGAVNAGSSVWGGAGGAGNVYNGFGNAGTSLYGGNGGTTRTAGAIPGGGGGCASGSGTSGAGGRGELRIWGIL